MFVGRSGSQWALIRAPDRKTFLFDWESISSDKSSWSREVCLSIRESKKSAKSFAGQLEIQWICWSGWQWALIRAPDHNKFFGRSGDSMSSDKCSWSQVVFHRSGSQWALIRASDRKMCVVLSGTEWTLVRYLDCKKFVGQSEIQCF